MHSQKSFSHASFVAPSVPLPNGLIVGLVHMNLGKLLNPGQISDSGVNFTSVYVVVPVTVHISFSVPQANFEMLVTRCTALGNPPSRGNFSPCEQIRTQMLRQNKSSLAHAHY